MTAGAVAERIAAAAETRLLHAWLYCRNTHKLCFAVFLRKKKKNVFLYFELGSVRHASMLLVDKRRRGQGFLKVDFEKKKKKNEKESVFIDQ